MNRIAIWYAHAIWETLAVTPAGSEDAVAKRVIALLRAKGHERIIPSILRELERLEDKMRVLETAIKHR